MSVKLQFTPSSKILFLADAHLGAFSEPKNQQLEEDICQLIEFAGRKNYHIAVLGDLFDYWMEYPSSVPALGEKMLAQFKRFNQNSPALYITGNHDYWTLGHFKKLGFDVEPDYRIYAIKNRTVLLLHGDAVGPEPASLQRPFWHRVIRNKIFLKVYRGLLPPIVGRYFMRKCSDITRETGSEKGAHLELDSWAKMILNNNDIDVLLCGHDHIPRIRTYGGGTYINAGSFSDNRTLIQYTNGNFRLVSWDRQQNEMIAYEPCELIYE